MIPAIPVAMSGQILPSSGITSMAASTPASASEVKWPRIADLTRLLPWSFRRATAFAGFAIAWAVAIQPDGRIVAAGGENQSYLARYNSDGSLDLTFGVGGKVTGAPPSGWFTAVAIQADGRIVAAGRGDTSDDFVVSRYNTDGSPDVTFGTGGTVVTDFGGVDHLWGLAIQADGKIVAVGTGGNFHFALARYTSDGHLDPSFDGDGMVITPFSEEGFDQAGTVVIQTNGKIVVAGSARLGPFTEFDYSFAVARYNTDGGLDPTFGTGGRVTTDFEGFRSDDAGHGVALDADGRRRRCRGVDHALLPLARHSHELYRQASQRQAIGAATGA